MTPGLAPKRFATGMSRTMVLPQERNPSEPMESLRVSTTKRGHVLRAIRIYIRATNYKYNDRPKPCQPLMRGFLRAWASLPGARATPPSLTPQRRSAEEASL